MVFQDPLNPTDEELRHLAYTPDAMYPDEMSQDWDLLITDFERAHLLLQFASDPDCPNRKFFLSCLYLLVGDCVRTPVGRERNPKCESFLSQIDRPLSEDIALWLSRSRELLRSPEKFNYNKWCWGGFAYGYEDT